VRRAFTPRIMRGAFAPRIMRGAFAPRIMERAVTPRIMERAVTPRICGRPARGEGCAALAPRGMRRAAPRIPRRQRSPRRAFTGIGLKRSARTPAEIAMLAGRDARCDVGQIKLAWPLARDPRLALAPGRILERADTARLDRVPEPHVDGIPAPAITAWRSLE
jgi:hypothetical protein